MYHRYIGDEYKDLIANIFKFELKNEDLHLTDFDNQKLRLTNIVKDLREKTIDACDRLFNFKLNVIIDDYMPKIETQYDNKKEL